MFHESFGNATGCALTRASRALLERPPDSFCDVALLSPRTAMAVADGGGLARQASAVPIGLQRKRRGAMTIPAPTAQDSRHRPMGIDVGETVCFKPDAGPSLLSAANEDPMAPCASAPEELDIAITVDCFQTLTSETGKRVKHRWAGRRSFAADRSLVSGHDTQAEGYFWLAGQGGYGTRMAPALARTAAAADISIVLKAVATPASR